MNWKTIFKVLFSFFIFIFPVYAYGATGDITGVRIMPHSNFTDGWVAEIDIQGFQATGTASYGFVDDGNASTTDMDPARAKIVFTVTSPGYTANGVATTYTRTVYGTIGVRKAYPLQSFMDESVSGGTLTVKVALSDYIYAGETVTVSIPNTWYQDTGTGGTNAFNNAVTNLSVTNNSQFQYPEVIGRWAWPGYEKVSSDFLVEMIPVHRFARNGKPVAAVAFQACDQSSNCTYATTTEMTVSTRSEAGDENTVLVYAATLDIDALDQGEVIDVNFRAYPWVGTSSAILDTRTTVDGTAQPHERLGALHLLNDRTGAYGVAYAYVDPVNGNDNTGTVYSSQAAAEAGNAFRTIGNAASSTKIYNNANFSRNDPSGAVILLAEGNHAYPGTTPSSDLGNSMSTWLTIKPASNADKADTIINVGAGTTATLKSSRVKIQGLTLSPSVTGASSAGFLGRASTDALWLHNNTINATSSNPLRGWASIYVTDNSITSLTNGLTGTVGNVRGAVALIRGNTASSLVRGTLYAIIGNSEIGPAFVGGGSNGSSLISTSSNSIFAFNDLLITGGVNTVNIAQTGTSTGIAIIQNVFERAQVGNNTGGDGLMSVAGASDSGTSTNFIFWHNTFAGGRHQFGYDTNGSTPVARTNWQTRFNIFTEQGIKSDTFDTNAGTANGVRVANWPLRYGVGNIGDKSLASSFEGEFKGLFSQWGPQNGVFSPGWVNDQSSYTSTDNGNGDYRLLSSSFAIDSATTSSDFYTVFPYDILGNPRYGSPDTGAYEYQPPYTMGTHNIATSASVRVYGDEKWRVIGATTSTASADLSVSLPGTDRTQWLDIKVTNWQNSGTRLKAWTEMSSTTGLTNTVHVVGDLAASTNYGVSVDGVVGQNITGASCTSGVCTSNSSGEITFTYTGSYSSHDFEVEQQSDITAPTITNVSSDKADGQYGEGETIDIDITFSEIVTSTGVATVTLETSTTDRTCTFTVTASTSATCNYTVQSGDSTSDLTVSSISGTIADANANAMTNFVPSTNLAANKNLVIDTSGPTRSAGSPTGELALGTTATTLSLTTDESATCKFGTTSETTYASIANTFTTTGGTSHSESITGLTNGTSYAYYVRCRDTALNVNSADYTISFSVAAEEVEEDEEEDRGQSSASQRARSLRQSVNEIAAQAVEAKYNVSPQAPAIVTIKYVTDLSSGTQGEEVRALQQFLIKQGHLAAGYDTGYFGPLTKAAIVSFQQRRGIPATGAFDPITRVAASITPEPASVGPNPNHITPVSSTQRDLTTGSRGEDVRNLQKFLNQNGFTISPQGPGSLGSETTYFGPATQAALIKFQIKYGISPAAGYFGPKTKAKMQEILSGN